MTGRGLDQERALKRPGEFLISIHLWTWYIYSLLSSTCLRLFQRMEHFQYKKAQATDLLDAIQCFEFAFHLHLMRMVMEIINDLSQDCREKIKTLWMPWILLNYLSIVYRGWEMKVGNLFWLKFLYFVISII